MLYRVGTEKELPIVASRLPGRVMTEVYQGILVLDAEYGTERDYTLDGGYSLILETADDLAELKRIIDIDAHPCEWATKIGTDTGYLSALYLLNDDFSIMVYMPIAIATETILRDLEE